jgi:ComF family protein
MLHLRTTRAYRGQLSHWLQRGLDLLFPPRCVACSQGGSWFCPACQASVERLAPPICSHCGRPVSDDERLIQTPSGRLCFQCQTSPLPLDSIRSVAVHDGAIRQAIHHLKYRRRRELAGALGQLLASICQEEHAPTDVVIPVPLHASRQRERGYNQAALLAQGLVACVPCALNETDLIRTRDTAPQVGLKARERKSNVHDAFVWRGASLDDVGVLLVDDVCTTGATLGACALALRRAGASSVRAVTLSRAR